MTCDRAAPPDGGVLRVAVAGGEVAEPAGRLAAAVRDRLAQVADVAAQAEHLGRPAGPRPRRPDSRTGCRAQGQPIAASTRIDSVASDSFSLRIISMGEGGDEVRYMATTLHPTSIEDRGHESSPLETRHRIVVRVSRSPTRSRLTHTPLKRSVHDWLGGPSARMRRAGPIGAGGARRPRSTGLRTTGLRELVPGRSAGGMRRSDHRYGYGAQRGEITQAGRIRHAGGNRGLDEQLDIDSPALGVYIHIVTDKVNVRRRPGGNYRQSRCQESDRE